MSLSKRDISEIRKFIKKLKKEGSTTAGVGGYATPKAFVGDPEAEGSAKATGADKAYIIKPSKKKRNFIKIHEVSYKTFKQDQSLSEVQKVNRKILEVNKMLREISQALDHSIKLKQESSLDDSTFWKRTNEAILKIHNRVNEVMKKTTKLANIKELAANSVKDKLVALLSKAGIDVKSSDIQHNQLGNEQYEFDIYINGEPHGIDYNNGDLTYQAMNDEIYLGNLKQQDETLINNIVNALKP